MIGSRPFSNRVINVDRLLRVHGTNPIYDHHEYLARYTILLYQFVGPEMARLDRIQALHGVAGHQPQSKAARAAARAALAVGRLWARLGRVEVAWSQ